MYSASSTPDKSETPLVGQAGSSRTAKLLSTERTASKILCDGDPRYRIPTPGQRKALQVGFAMCGKSLIGKAYDAVHLDDDVILDDPDDIAKKNASITIVEIKSTSQAKIGADLSGYFFNITAAELLVAQTLKDQFRFIFVNTVRGDWQDLSLSEVFTKMKAIYPAYHIKL